MEVGPVGLLGVLAVKLVEEEIKHNQGTVQILYQLMGARIVVPLALKLKHRFVTPSLAQMQ